MTWPAVKIVRIYTPAAIAAEKAKAEAKAKAAGECPYLRVVL